MTSTMEWIRRTYDVPARHGMRIEYDGKPATIVGTRGPYLAFRVDGEKRITTGHPCYRIVYPAVPEPARPRGWCKHCMQDRAMKDGVMGCHQWHGRNWSELCPGSGQPPWKPVRNLTHPGEQRAAELAATVAREGALPVLAGPHVTVTKRPGGGEDIEFTTGGAS